MEEEYSVMLTKTTAADFSTSDYISIYGQKQQLGNNFRSISTWRELIIAGDIQITEKRANSIAIKIVNGLHTPSLIYELCETMFLKKTITLDEWSDQCKNLIDTKKLSKTKGGKPLFNPLQPRPTMLDMEDLMTLKDLNTPVNFAVMEAGASILRGIGADSEVFVMSPRCLYRQGKKEQIFAVGVKFSHLRCIPSGKRFVVFPHLTGTKDEDDEKEDGGKDDAHWVTFIADQIEKQIFWYNSLQNKEKDGEYVAVAKVLKDALNVFGFEKSISWDLADEGRIKWKTQTENDCGPLNWLFIKEMINQKVFPPIAPKHIRMEKVRNDFFLSIEDMGDSCAMTNLELRENPKKHPAIRWDY